MAPKTPLSRRDAPSRYQLIVPEGWFELDFAPRALERQIRQAVMAGAEADVTRRAQAERLTHDLEAIVRSARQRGVIYGAGMLQAFDDDVVSATIMVSAVTGVAGEGDLLSQLARMRPVHNTMAGAWQKVVPVELPHAGPAGRVLGVDLLPVTKAVSLPYVTMQTVIPIPRTPGAVVVTGGSPNVRLVTELHQLFDAITSTFRFVTATTEPAR